MAGLGFQVNEALKELIPGVRVLCLCFYVLGYYPRETQRVCFSQVFQAPGAALAQSLSLLVPSLGAGTE